MSAVGAPAKQIAEALHVTPQTVSNWRRRWIERGPFGLKDAPRPGGPLKVTPRYLRLMAEAVDRGPQAYGYIFTTWSVKRLVVHLQRRTKIRISHQRLRQLLHQHGFVCRRPKHTLKGKRNEREYRRVKQRLEALKKGLCAEEPATNFGLRTRPTSICIPT
jgi:transposase